MRKVVSLICCISLGFFMVARAAKPYHAATAGARPTPEKPGKQRADAQNLADPVSMNVGDENTDEETTPDNGYSVDDASGEGGHEISDDDNDDGGDEDAPENDEGNGDE
jgi:hypothetical protein